MPTVANCPLGLTVGPTGPAGPPSPVVPGCPGIPWKPCTIETDVLVEDQTDGQIYSQRCLFLRHM